MAPRFLSCLGFGVWGLGFGVWGLGSGVYLKLRASIKGLGSELSAEYIRSRFRV